jgi:hypothetical protein
MSADYRNNTHYIVQAELVEALVHHQPFDKLRANGTRY